MVFLCIRRFNSWTGCCVSWSVRSCLEILVYGRCFLIFWFYKIRRILSCLSVLCFLCISRKVLMKNAMKCSCSKWWWIYMVWVNFWFYWFRSWVSVEVVCLFFIFIFWLSRLRGFLIVLFCLWRLCKKWLMLLLSVRGCRMLVVCWVFWRGVVVSWCWWWWLRVCLVWWMMVWCLG